MCFVSDASLNNQANNLYQMPKSKLSRLHMFSSDLFSYTLPQISFTSQSVIEPYLLECILHALMNLMSGLSSLGRRIVNQNQ